MPEGEAAEPVDELDPEFVRLTPARAVDVWFPAAVLGVAIAGSILTIWWPRPVDGSRVWVLVVAAAVIAIFGVRLTVLARRARLALAPDETFAYRRFLVVGCTALSVVALALSLVSGFALGAVGLAPAALVVATLLRRPDGPMGERLLQVARRAQPILIGEGVVGILALPVLLLVESVADLPDASASGYERAALTTCFSGIVLLIALAIARRRRARPST